jgi:hypothetical protein
LLPGFFIGDPQLHRLFFLNTKESIEIYRAKSFITIRIAAKKMAGTIKRFVRFLIPWLVTRLFWGIEISRLALLRVKPRHVVNRLSKSQRELSPGCWVYDRNKLYHVSVFETKGIVVTEMPVMEPN